MGYVWGITLPAGPRPEPDQSKPSFSAITLQFYAFDCLVGNLHVPQANRVKISRENECLGSFWVTSPEPLPSNTALLPALLRWPLSPPSD